MDGKTAVVERTLPGPIERVWRYLTEPDLLAKWLGRGMIGGVGSSVQIVQGDESPWQSSTPIVGTVLRNEPPHLLEYTWSHPGQSESPESLVRFELSDVDGEVLLRIVHTKLTSDDEPLISAGWLTHTQFLLELLESRPHEPFLQAFRRYYKD